MQANKIAFRGQLAQFSQLTIKYCLFEHVFLDKLIETPSTLNCSNTATQYTKQVTVNTINPDLFTKLMSLPDGARLDLLEFLGATPVGEEQLNTLISEIETSNKSALPAQSA